MNKIVQDRLTREMPARERIGRENPERQADEVATTAIRRESQIAVHSAGDKSARAAGDTSSAVVSFQNLVWFADHMDPKIGNELFE